MADETTEKTTDPTPSGKMPGPGTTDAGGVPMLTRDQFDADAYLKNNPDVAAAIRRGEFGGDPYAHYQQYGYKEGRTKSAQKAGATTTDKPNSGTDNTGVNQSTFNAKIEEAIKKAYPNKSKDAAWLAQQVKYYADKKATVGKPGDDDYWIKRASGWQAGGSDVAEAGDYAPGGSLYEANGGANGGGFSPYGGPDFVGGQGSPIGEFKYDGPGVPQYQAPEGAGVYKPFEYNGPTDVPAIGAPQQVQAGSPYQPNTITPQTVNPEQIQSQRAELVQAGYAPEVAAQMLPMPDKFQATTEADLYADPSYKFRVAQGQQALENNNAARGLSRTGGAYKGLIDYGQNAASQEFGNVDARRYRNFTGDVQNAYQYGSTNAANALNAAQFNSGQKQQVNLANASYGNQANQFNAANENQARQYNAGNRQQAGQFNAANNLTAQGQNVANATNAAQQGWQNQYNAANANNANALGYGNYNLSRQGQLYGQGASTYGLNQAAQQQAFGQNLSGYQAGLAGQGQAYNQAQNTYGTNLAAQNQGFNQALQGWQANVAAQQGYGNFYLGNNALNWAQSTWFPNYNGA